MHLGCYNPLSIPRGTIEVLDTFGFRNVNIILASPSSRVSDAWDLVGP